MNVDEHDGRRTAATLLGAAVIGIAAVAATFWVFNGVVSSPAVGSAQVVMATPASTNTTIPDVPTTSTSTIVVPTPTVIPFTPSSVSVAPAELPTMTAPVEPPGPTTSSTPPKTAPTAPAPPVTVPTISGVSMFCRKNGDRVEGGLTFRTTTVVPVSLVAGGKIEQQAAAGPGIVSVTAVGKRGSFCMATVGSQRFGPIAAS